MSNPVTRSLSNITVFICKNLTLFLFLILPAKVTNVFISLSILLLIYKAKAFTDSDYTIDGNKFKSMLSINYNEELMLLPKHTVKWFWSDEFLEKPITLVNGTVKIKEALGDNKYLIRNPRTIVRRLLDNIPYILKYKLNLKDVSNRLAIEHNVIKLFINS